MLLRRSVSRVVAVAILIVTAWLTQLPSYSSSERTRIASEFSFERLQILLPAPPSQTVREVQPGLRHIAAWISSVGAAVSLSDVDEDGRSNDVCLVDPRSDRVTLAPAPRTGDRYEAFTLDPRPLAYDDQTTAPMGCLPGDYNEDGHRDLLVYYWGRTPVAFIRLDRPLGPVAFARQEVVPEGGRWFTDTITSADVDGDGHLDLIVGNYFPDGARVLDASAVDDPLMQMPDSMSRAYNGGRNQVLLWARPRAGARVRFSEAVEALSERVASGWTLAVGAADLNDDLRPELYFANDFGPDRLLYNSSSPGAVRLAVVEGLRGLRVPASKVLGRDSFKGMGVDFGDLNEDGKLDFFVSNITSEYALEESNFAFVSDGSPSDLTRGRAPFTDRSEPLQLSRSGWGWDAKIADFNGDGVNEVVQALGFLRGSIDRWPELHELAMANDALLRHASLWPRFIPGDDLDGDQDIAFFVKGPAGRYAELSREVGITAPSVTRGVATGDIDADGDVDFAVAGQWGPSYLFLNQLGGHRSFLGLRLMLPVGGARGETRVLGGLPTDVLGRPSVGAVVEVRLEGERTLVAQVDGGNGHASARAPELVFGLEGARGAVVEVRLAWRDGFGIQRRQTLWLQPGWHTIMLAQGPSS